MDPIIIWLPLLQMKIRGAVFTQGMLDSFAAVSTLFIETTLL